MSATGQGGEGQTQGEGQGGGESQGPDLGSMVDQIGQIAAGQEEMRQFLASNPWQAQQGDEQQQDPGQGEGDDTIDLSFLDPQNAVYEDPTAVATRLNEAINGAVEQRVQQALTPLQQQQAELRRDQEARDLAGEFPEIADEKMAKLIAGPDGLAVQMAQQIGMPQLAHEPKFWRLTYLAHKATEAANAQNGADAPNAANLESGSGPGPAQQPTQEDRIKAIMEAGGRGSRVLDFKT